MAISRLGDVITFNTSGNTGSSAVTVPNGTVLTLLTMGGYFDGYPGTISKGTVTIAGATMSAAIAGDTNGSFMGGALFTDFNTPAGSQTVTWDLTGTSNFIYGTQVHLSFFAGVNSGDVFRDKNFQQNQAGAGAAATCASGQAGDYMYAAGLTWNNLTPAAITHVWTAPAGVTNLDTPSEWNRAVESVVMYNPVSTALVTASISGTTGTSHSFVSEAILKAGPTVDQCSAQFFSGGDEIPHWDTTSYRYWPGVRSDRTSAGAAGASVRLPDTIANGDMLILVAGANDDVPAFDGPTGWTSVQHAQSTGNDRQLLFSYKYITNATGLGSATTALAAGSDPYNYWVAAVSGITTPEYFSSTNFYVDWTNGTTMTTSAFTTVTPSAYAIAAMISNNDTATTAPSSPWTTEADDAADGNSTFNVSTQIVATSGTSTGSASWGGGDGASEFTTGLVCFATSGWSVSAHDGRTSAAAVNASATLCGDSQYGWHFRIENNSGAAITSAFKVQYYAASAASPAWTDVSSSSNTVRACATTDFVNGADVAEYLYGSGTYHTDNNAAIETSGGFQLSSNLGAASAFEGHLNFYLEETDVYDDDVIYLRVVKQDGTALTYTATATIVANAIGTRATNKSIDADGGSYAVAGQTVALQAARQLIPSAGTYNVTGQAATLQRALQLPIGAGSYALAGQNITFPRSYVVVPGAGSYLVAGQTVALQFGRQIAPGVGTYTINGQVVGLELDKELVIGAGSYAVAGQTATFNRTYVIVPDAGAYALAGQAVTFAKGQSIIPGAGAYVIDGKTATLTHERQIIPDAGSYAVAGQEVTLTYTPAAAKEMTAEGGSYAVAGQAVALYIDRQLPAGAGSYTVAGQTAALQTAKALIPDAGSYVVAGQTVGLQKGVTLVPDSGSYALAGQAATLQMARQLVANYGEYTITGVAAVMSKGAYMTVDAGSYVLDGKAVTFPRVYILLPDAGAYTVDGKEVTLTYTAAAKSIDAEAGSYAVGGQNVALQVDRQLGIGTGSYVVAGEAASLELDRQLIPGTGSYVIDGKTVELTKDVTIVMGTGAYTVAGQAAGLELDRILVIGEGAYLVTGTAVDLTYSGLVNYYIKGIDIASGKFVYIKVLSTNLV